jgi:hypothetical protein
VRKKNAHSLNDFEFVRKKFVRKKSAHSKIAHSQNVFDVVRKNVVRKKSAHREIAHKLVNQTSIPPARLFRDSLKIYGKNKNKQEAYMPAFR